MWTNANPILGVAEIGYETDTNKFKIGDGTNRWADLSYFVDLDTMIEGAPGLLNSLDEIAAAIGDDPEFFTTIATGLATKAPIASPTFTGTVSGVTKAHVGLGNVDNTSDANKPISTATQTALDLKANSADITELSQDAVNSALTAGSGITKTYNDSANTITVAVDSTIATKTYADSAVSTEVTNRNSAISTHNSATTSVHGIADTAALATKVYADNAVSTHEQDTTNIHGIADTSALATKTYADNAASTAVAAVIDSAPAALNTLNELAAALGDDENYAATITSALALKAPINAPTFTGTVSGITKTMVGLGNVDNTSDANKPVSSATQTALDAKASNTALQDHENDTTNIHGIADTSALATKTYADGAVSTAVSALTKSSVGLGNVDNTSDVNKPISSATQTALDLKAPINAPTFTGTVSGITKAMVGLGSVDNTADTAKPISTATQTALDLKLASATAASTYAPLASPALTGVPTAPTASAATNTTQVATTAYVRGEISALVNSATSTLDTLGEIATALGNDANLSTTLTNAIALKAPTASPTFTGTVTIPAGASISGFATLASPALTGNPTAPTQTLGNDSTRVATTAFVKAAIQDIASLNLVLDGGGV
jgi:hypothetical protein